MTPAHDHGERPETDPATVGRRRSLNEQYWPDDYHWCFGCGPKNQCGLQLTLYEREGAVVARWEPRPEHQNWAGIIHGGVQTAALDELAGTAAWLAFRRDQHDWPLVVSAEITVGFRAPARVESALDCSARVRDLGDRHALVDAKLELDGTEVTTMVGRYVMVE